MKVLRRNKTASPDGSVLIIIGMVLYAAGGFVLHDKPVNMQASAHSLLRGTRLIVRLETSKTGSLLSSQGSIN